MRSWLACLVALLGTPTVTAASSPDAVRAGAQELPTTPSQFFDVRRVWNIELSLSAKAWEELQPQSIQQPSAVQPWSRFLAPEGERNGVAAARGGIEFDYVHADLAINGHKFADVGLRYKGNGTFLNANGDKKPLKVQLDRYVRDQRMGGITTLNLQNSVTDASFMNEALAYRLYRDAGVPSPRTGYARVSLSINGETPVYLGLYSISEGIEPEFFAGRNVPPGGAILKPSLQVPFTLIGEDWSDYRQAYDPKTDLTRAQKQRVIEFSRLVSNADDAEFGKRLPGYLDIDQFARYFAVLAWLGNTDSLLRMGQNYYVYMRPNDQRLIFLPWDQDGSFGNFGRRRGDAAVSLDIAQPWTPGIRFLDRVMNVEAVREAYDRHMAEFSRTLFLPERFAQQIEEIAPVIRPAILDESPWMADEFERAVRGEVGIMPFARQRAEFVTRQLRQ